MQPPITLDKCILRLIAMRASCDPRTVARVARGQSVRGLAGRRARAALLAYGYPVPPIAEQMVDGAAVDPPARCQACGAARGTGADGCGCADDEGEEP